MNKARLLLVDDDPTHTMLMGLYFENDYVVHSAATVLEAQDALRSSDFDLVITDYYLPDGTATDLLERLNGAKVILISGADLDRDYLQRFDKAIMKPVDLDLIDQAILSLQNNS